MLARLRSHLFLFAIFRSCLAAFPDCANGPLASNLVCDTTASPMDRARALVANFTIEEKINNTVNMSPGVPRLGLPPYNWWSEALHGVASSPGVTFDNTFRFATSFPSPITLGAAFDDPLINQVATVISTEARAFGNGNHSGLDFFTPNINPFKDPRWGRGQETPGEDPFHIARYVFQLITGLQGGVAPEPYIKVIADCKHWAAYDLENWEGNSRMAFNAIVSQQDLAEYYSPSFQSCVRDAKVASIMCSYNSVNGVPSCANSFLLQDIAREFWGLGDQWITSDCDAVGNVFDPHHFTDTLANASAVSLLAGTDVDCGTSYADSLGDALDQGLVTEDDISKSLVRLYASLVRLGFFDPPENQPYRQITFDDVNSPQAQELAHNAAVEGIVLLKNDGLLPLKNATNTTVAMIGPWANATTQMQSNYNGVAPFLISPVQGFMDAGFNVLFSPGTLINTTGTTNFSAAIDAANQADVIVFAGGIDDSVEAEGHDRIEITWPGNQLDLIRELAGLEKPLIVLQMGGGQVDSSELKANDSINALIWGGYPGQSGGAALAEIVAGVQAPAGRLPTTQYPADYVNQIPMTDMSLRPSDSSPGRTYKWFSSPVFEFGFGLHYTTFSFEWASNGTDSYNIQDSLSAANSSDVEHTDLALFDTFDVTVTNTGSTTSDYVALLFSNTTAGPQPAPLKELVGYTRVKDLAPGQSTVASLNVTLGSIARFDEDGNTVLYPGTYTIWLDTTGEIARSFEITGDEARILTWPQP
ncbi:beta-xylosidase [Dendrothele bispora CBS 962.96]|uniref:xylan 1,4-beta-xylosidase n=1 Tax=Dendrothele bispora (strain CBS 962.96) TaxID=1314807 RepID=A0A4S8MP50_DENBC|nr:beta-xylosidase [Dendrothele bispora CBS 962.96]